MILDEVRFAPGLLLIGQVTESLAGRAAILRLLPMSRREVHGRIHAPLAWEAEEGPASAGPPLRWICGGRS